MFFVFFYNKISMYDSYEAIIVFNIINMNLNQYHDKTMSFCDKRVRSFDAHDLIKILFHLFEIN